MGGDTARGPASAIPATAGITLQRRGVARVQVRHQAAVDRVQLGMSRRPDRPAGDAVDENWSDPHRMHSTWGATDRQERASPFHGIASQLRGDVQLDLPKSISEHVVIFLGCAEEQIHRRRQAFKSGNAPVTDERHDILGGICVLLDCIAELTLELPATPSNLESGPVPGRWWFELKEVLSAQLSQPFPQIERERAVLVKNEIVVQRYPSALFEQEQGLLEVGLATSAPWLA